MEDRSGNNECILQGYLRESAIMSMPAVVSILCIEQKPCGHQIHHSDNLCLFRLWRKLLRISVRLHWSHGCPWCIEPLHSKDFDKSFSSSWSDNTSEPENSSDSGKGPASSPATCPMIRGILLFHYPFGMFRQNLQGPTAGR